MLITLENRELFFKMLSSARNSVIRMSFLNFDLSDEKNTYRHQFFSGTVVTMVTKHVARFLDQLVDTQLILRHKNCKRGHKLPLCHPSGYPSSLLAAPAAGDCNPSGTAIPVTYLYLGRTE